MTTPTTPSPTPTDLPIEWRVGSPRDRALDPVWRAALDALQRPWRLQATGDLAHRLLLEPQAVGDAALGPRSLFSDDADPAHAVALGIDGLWPRSTLADAPRLARALQLDAARWHRDQALRTDMERARTQLAERRWVERAKGVLMQARGLSEEEAFRLLRGASMQSNLRVGEVSRSVTEAAQWAEAVNRAGQLRMLSQRVVKLAAQRLDGIDPRRARQTQGMAIGRLQDNLDFLASLPVMHDSAGPAHLALAATDQAWRALKPVLMQRLTPATLAQSDALGEALLQRAEALTEVLEAGGARRALRLVNLCGRQRMRVQRLAKQALLAVLLQETTRQDALPALLDDVEATLQELERAPLGSPAARETLAQAREQWLHLLRGLRLAQGSEGRQALAVASDALLALFDRLTADYEHSLQLILS